jgi:hypothetical protein
VADEGLVAVLRSITGSWKMPMAYYLIKGSPKCFMAQVNECLKAAAEAGVEVLVFTCDQCTTQWSSMIKVGVSVEHPYFIHPVSHKKVFVFADIPHCLKNCRNALRTNRIEFESGKFARWDDFTKLWELECGNQLKFNSKLTINHVELPVGANMKVKVAAQTLSRRTAAAIRCYYRLNMIQKCALDTAEFMERVGDLFHLGNSVSPCDEDRKSSVTLLNVESKLAAMKNGILWIGKWKFHFTKNGKQNNHHTFNHGS